jgi:hypothetical protein
MRNWLYAVAFVAGFFTAQYAASDEDTGAEVEQAYLEGVQYGAREATLRRKQCNWRDLYVMDK